MLGMRVNGGAQRLRMSVVLALPLACFAAAEARVSLAQQAPTGPTGSSGTPTYAGSRYTGLSAYSTPQPTPRPVERIAAAVPVTVPTAVPPVAPPQASPAAVFSRPRSANADTTFRTLAESFGSGFDTPASNRPVIEPQASSPPPVAVSPQQQPLQPLQPPMSIPPLQPLPQAQIQPQPGFQPALQAPSVIPPPPAATSPFTAPRDEPRVAARLPSVLGLLPGMPDQQRETRDSVPTQAEDPLAEWQPGNAGTTAAMRSMAADDAKPCTDPGSRPPRFYLSAIGGGSYLTLDSGGANVDGGFTNTGSFSSSVASAGGAGGLAWDRSGGQLRLEIEGRWRSDVSGTTASAPDVPLDYAVTAADAWTVTTNVWRDIWAGNHWGLYLGGGIGGGGYELTVNDNFVAGTDTVGTFAWLAGTGVTYRFDDRLALDLGYRFVGFGTGTIGLNRLASNAPAGYYTSSLGGSELIFSLRLYEPFRGWKR